MRPIVLALPLASLLHREARAAWLARGLDALLKTLADLHLVVDTRPPVGASGPRCTSRKGHPSKLSSLTSFPCREAAPRRMKKGRGCRRTLRAPVRRSERLWSCVAAY